MPDNLPTVPVDGEASRPLEDVVERWNKGEAALSEEIARNAAGPMPAPLPPVRNPRAHAWITAAIGSLSLAMLELANQQQPQHEAAADSIVDQLTTLYKAVTK